MRQIAETGTVWFFPRFYCIFVTIPQVCPQSDELVWLPEATVLSTVLMTRETVGVCAKWYVYPSRSNDDGHVAVLCAAEKMPADAFALPLLSVARSQIRRRRTCTYSVS